MSKDYTTVDVRHLKSKDKQLVMAVEDACSKALGKTLIWSQSMIPHKLLITSDQFKEFARLRGDTEKEPTGKELYQTKLGYVFEIKVGD